MDFRLKVFAAVAKHLSFTHAARELGISQPAVTKHIQELEGAYNVQLFERTGGKIYLTVAGDTFLKHAKDIITKYDTLLKEMQLLAYSFTGEIRLGASIAVLQHIAMPLLTDFIERFPDMKISLYSGTAEQVESALREGTIDIAILDGANREPDFEYLAFASDELVMVTCPSNAGSTDSASGANSTDKGTKPENSEKFKNFARLWYSVKYSK